MRSSPACKTREDSIDVDPMLVDGANPLLSLIGHRKRSGHVLLVRESTFNRQTGLHAVYFNEASTWLLVEFVCFSTIHFEPS